MDVILLENIGNLGGLGDKVTVKAGYGRNFLIPQGKAVPATADNVSKFEARRAELEAAAAETLAAAQARGEALTALGTVEIAATAGEEGKLFGPRQATIESTGRSYVIRTGHGLTPQRFHPLLDGCFDNECRM